MTKAHSPTVELASQLVSRASVTPEDAGCQPLLAERLEALGFDSYWLPVGDVSNLLCLRGAKGPLLLFLGHTDVVPAGDRGKWRSAPFDPQIRDGKLYGRGSADMKGSIAAFISACERLLEGGERTARESAHRRSADQRRGRTGRRRCPGCCQNTLRSHRPDRLVSGW